MMAPPDPVARTGPLPLVLAGAGHAHLVALRHWADAGWRAPAGSVLINPSDRAWYSGMMPGLLAGRFREKDCAVDLLPLCEASGITLIGDRVTDLSPGSQALSTENDCLGYELLSINSGSKPPRPVESDGSIDCVPARPFPAFVETWQRWRTTDAPTRLAILGGGAAAFELAMALRTSLPECRIALVSRDRLLAGHPPGLARKALALLRKNNIDVQSGRRIDAIRDGRLLSGYTVVTSADTLVLASGAAPLDWYRKSGLETEDGFFRVEDSLQCQGHPEILAAGDSISLAGAQRSGVYSVRQGSILAHNIPALLEGRPLRRYRPQPRALALLATADGGALLSYGRWTAQGRLPGLWKDHLDTSFIRRHRL